MYFAPEIRLEIEKCSKCGKCQSVCPVYIETLDEKKVARGRITLFEALLDDDLRYTDTVKEAIQSCLKCLRCVSICINDVRFDKIITAIREKMPRKYGLSLVNRIIFRYILPNRSLTNLLYRFGYYAQFLLPYRKGVTRHLPLLWSGRRSIPKLDSRSVLQKYGSNGKPQTGEKAVYFFTGCMLNYVETGVSDSIINVLRHFEYKVIVPKRQVCCGTPVMSVGDMAAARSLVRRNISTFDGNIPIITACASCGETLKHNYEYLLGKEASQFSTRVFDFTEFIDKFIGFDPSIIEKKVIYHDPCHLKFGQGISKQPRRLLKKSSNYVETEGADYCCGMAGLFSVHHYPLAVKIARRKTGAMKKHNADLLVTECPGCMVQLRDRFADDGVNIRVQHIANLLEEALLKKR
jgi:glycolate oxidase iron-sulfur subunit